MNASHIAGGGLGALAGVILAALGAKIGLHLDDTTAAALGAGCLSAGVALGHAIGEYGLAGIAAVIVHGRAKTTAATLFPPAPPSS